MSVVFLHLPKSAGSSLANMLAAHFAPEAIYRPEPRELGGRSREELAGYGLIHGHCQWSELAAIPRPVRIVSLMREPLARALSLYWYWRAHTWAYGVEEISSRGVQFAKTLSMEAFFGEAPPDVMGNFENAVARQLVGAEYLAMNTGFTIPDQEVIRICRAHLDAMVFCGLTERFAASAAAILGRLGLPASATRADNTLAGQMLAPGFETVRPTPPSPALLARLRDLNAIDAALYRHVRDGWRMRLASAAQAMRGGIAMAQSAFPSGRGRIRSQT
ncbi:MAG TPA: hypothetical protein VGN38_09105 [Caulobacteraceae bacterium]|nr:hypothetical protein [Caulobacteraceae bacterium]